MNITINASGLNALKQRIEQAQATFKSNLQTAIQTEADNVMAQLASATPQGRESSGSNPSGDSEGPLSQSYVKEDRSTGDTVGVAIKTTQPNKMRFVREGTGLYGPLNHRIYPRQALALFWQGAPHPYRSVAGQHPNDFVSPVVEAGLKKLAQAARDAAKETMQEIVGA